MEFRKMLRCSQWSYMQDIKRDSDVKTDFWTMWEKARVGWFERTALKSVYFHMPNGWPVQVQCMKQGTESWCSATTQRDGVGRKVGGGSGCRTHVHLWLIQVDVWQKIPQYCKAISLQLKYINKIKDKKIYTSRSLSLRSLLNCTLKFWTELGHFLLCA